MARNKSKSKSKSKPKNSEGMSLSQKIGLGIGGLAVASNLSDLYIRRIIKQTMVDIDKLEIGDIDKLDRDETLKLSFNIALSIKYNNLKRNYPIKFSVDEETKIEKMPYSELSLMPHKYKEFLYKLRLFLDTEYISDNMIEKFKNEKITKILNRYDMLTKHVIKGDDWKKFLELSDVKKPTLEQVESQYKNLRRIHHPDKYHTKSEKVKETTIFNGVGIAKEYYDNYINPKKQFGSSRRKSRSRRGSN